MLEDVLGWVAVLIAAFVLKFYQTPYLDPALSIVITAYILWGVIRRLKETMFVFLQGAPKDIDLKEIMEQLQQIPHVKSIHHTHIWSMDGENHVFSTHIKLQQINSMDQLLTAKSAAKKYLSSFSFDHLALEMELDEENCDMKPENEG